MTEDTAGRTFLEPDEIMGLTFWGESISAQAVDYQSGPMIRIHQMQGSGDPSGTSDIEITFEDAEKLAELLRNAKERWRA